jgi:membrane-bound lytic murein transglycosylase D
MKKYITLLFLLIGGSLLFGCNTVVTKSHLGKPAVLKMADNKLAYDGDRKVNSYVDSYRIDTEPTVLVSSQQSALFSKAWTNESNPKRGMVNPSKRSLASNSQTNRAPVLQARTLPNRSRIPNTSRKSGVVNNTNKVAGSSTKTFGSKTRAERKSRVYKPKPTTRWERKPFAKRLIPQTRRTNRYFGKHYTEKTLSANQIIAKIIAETRLNTNSATANNFVVYGRNNLWNRIPRGYKLSAIDNYQIQKEIKKFVSNPSYFRNISTKARPYLYHIVAEVERRGIPLEIALLPAIESAFKPTALSHKSAAGLWQFMPATGRDYGLVQNRWYDGRRDITKSTKAALTYLQYLHDLFGDDWALALAAYNYGEGNVRKAIRRNRARGKPTDFWSLKLPRETRQYVPKLLALARIVANPQRYGVRLQPIANQRYFKQVNINRPIDLSLAAQLASMPLSEFKLLNPGYRRDTTAPRGPYYLTLPVNKVAQFRQRLAKVPPLMFTKRGM